MKITRNKVELSLPRLTSLGEEFDLPESHFTPGTIGRVSQIKGQSAGKTHVILDIVGGRALSSPRVQGSGNNQYEQERDRRPPQIDISRMPNMTPRDRFMNGTQRLEGDGGTPVFASGDPRPRTGPNNQIVQNSPGTIDKSLANPLAQELVAGMLGGGMQGQAVPVSQEEAEARGLVGGEEVSQPTISHDNAKQRSQEQNEAWAASEFGIQVTREQKSTRTRGGRRKSRYSSNFVVGDDGDYLRHPDGSVIRQEQDGIRALSNSGVGGIRPPQAKEVQEQFVQQDIQRRKASKSEDGAQVKFEEMPEMDLLDDPEALENLLSTNPAGGTLIPGVQGGSGIITTGNAHVERSPVSNVQRQTPYPIPPHMQNVPPPSQQFSGMIPLVPANPDNNGMNK